MNDLVVIGERRLRAAGKRITPQRRLVLGILGQASKHLDANEIHEQGRRIDSSLSLSTVYRTLGTLKDVRVVRELHLDGEHHHYELYDRGDHYHLVCLECGRVLEVDSSPFAQAAAAAGRIHGFRVASAEVELSGFCAECRDRGASHQA
jgi:Fur family ferric uptake transcriptional regulator